MTSRYTREGAAAPQAAPGWNLEVVCPPAALFGANGIRFGPDGRLYICEGLGRKISAYDCNTGAIETIVPPGVIPVRTTSPSGPTVRCT